MVDVVDNVNKTIEIVNDIAQTDTEACGVGQLQGSIRPDAKQLLPSDAVEPFKLDLHLFGFECQENVLVFFGIIVLTIGIKLFRIFGHVDWAARRLSSCR